MRFLSTRGEAPAVSLSAAIATGLAPDGGLYVPERLPPLAMDDWDPDWPLADVATRLLAPFFEGDPLADQLPAMTQAAFSFPVEITQPSADRPSLSVLELFHGPTAAFKDFGARFLAEALCRLQPEGADPFTVLVATSGDTGGAVGAAFDERPQARVAILFPKGRVSPLQQHQLTCWSDSVLSLCVDGDFDACQALAKAAFADAALVDRYRLTSANSINIARLFAQMTYFAWTALRMDRTGQTPLNVIIPTGNLGHALSALWVKAMGAPIGRIICATNANRTVPDFLASGTYRPRPSIKTLANAMDVGAPSNAERLIRLLAQRADLRSDLSADAIGDDAIAARIAADYAAHGTLWCPHTATAAEIHARLGDGVQKDTWCLVATAHPAKFKEVVEPLIPGAVALPPALERLAERPSRAVSIAPELAALGTAFASRFDGA